MEDISIDVDIKKEELLKILEQTNVSSFLDSWGPSNVIQIYDPELNIQGILVIDNTILGPGCGGIRISPTITPRHVFRTARRMTLSCALADINFGGAAAGIRADPSEIDKKRAIKTFAKGVSPYVPDQYIAAPDQNVGQEEMAAFAEEVGDRRGVTGKPKDMNGIPYELGVIGFGMGVAIEAAIELSQAVPSLPSKVTEIKVAIQGFDNIGFSLSKYLTNKGAKIVALSDEWCTIYDRKGIDINKIQKDIFTNNGKSPLKNFKDVKRLQKDDIIKADCDILIATTGTKILVNENVKSLKAKCVVEGINEPIDSIADMVLSKKGILVLPDVLTTAGGVISSYAEYNNYSSERGFSLIESKIKNISEKVIPLFLESTVPLRRIIKEIAKERILQTREAA